MYLYVCEREEVKKAIQFLAFPASALTISLAVSKETQTGEKR